MKNVITFIISLFAFLLFVVSVNMSVNNSSDILMPITELKETARTLTQNTEAQKNDSEYQYVGTFRVTAYCPCYGCSEGYGNMTSTGVRAKSDHTVAVDPSVIPYGSVVYVNGVEYKAEDCGYKIKGNKLDVYFDSHIETEVFGVRYFPVYIKVGNTNK